MISSEDILIHYEELMLELSSPDVTSDAKKFQKLMKEQADLAPIVEAYKEYKKAKQAIEDSLAMLEEESDEEMRELAKMELSDAKKQVEELEQTIKILLPSKDPNDDKNIVLEIRAGAGGDEAALFAAELYRMYVNYAESQRWKIELVSVNENGIGGIQGSTGHDQPERALTLSLSMNPEFTVYSECRRQSPADVFIPYRNRCSYAGGRRFRYCD